MLSKRIIPCLDVRDGRVVKGVRFLNHRDIGDIGDYALWYRDAGADELVIYDITASSEGRLVDRSWLEHVARRLDIPVCVAGGIRSIRDARAIFRAGADKISINSPALENPALITALAREFGSQSIVVGIDSLACDGRHEVCQYTGSAEKTRTTGRQTLDWAMEAVSRGAGEIVLNSMHQDGVRQGYDIPQVALLCDALRVPVVASGGAGSMNDFLAVFRQTNVSGALAASVFHDQHIGIRGLKQFLSEQGIEVRR